MTTNGPEQIPDGPRQPPPHPQGYSAPPQGNSAPQGYSSPPQGPSAPQGHSAPPPAQAPWGQPGGQSVAGGSGSPARSGLDLGKLRMADHAVAAGTLLYLILSILPWYSSIEVGGVEFDLPDAVNGFDFGSITFAFVLLLLATAWALLPAVTDIAVPFPRSFVTAGLAALAFVLTLIEWLSNLDAGFSVTGFLALLVSAAVLAFAVLRLLPDLRGSKVPGGLSGATSWANQPAPQFGQQFGQQSGQQSGGYGQPGQAAAQQPAPWGQPLAQAQPPSYGQPPQQGQPPYGRPPQQQAPWGQPPVAPPSAPGGSTAADPGERPGS